MSDSQTGASQAPFPQGDLRLLGTELAQELLAAPVPARLAFVWADGTPRVIPTWFHWTGAEIVMVTYTAGPNIGVRHPASRLAALRSRPRVALTIDTDGFPPRALSVRGDVEITDVDGIAPEYAAAARRYLGEEAATGMLAGLDQPGTAQARIALRPAWVGLLDFASRLPSAQGGVLR